jgi:hypothetical protein
MAKRAPRRFGIPQAKRRLKSIKLELAAIGGAYDQSVGEIRRRVLGLIAAIHELIERFPLPPSE